MKTVIFQQTLREKETSTLERWGEWAGLFFILVLAAFLRLWRIEQNGYGNPYYAATVRSMMLNWHNFFFASYDPAGWVSVDKPPVSLWFQTLSAELLGFSGFHLILPQVVEGCLSIALVYGLVRRAFDAWAAWVAAWVMAVGPICVAVDRYNNTDECMMFIILLAAWAMFHAVEKASRKWMLLSVALVGIGFNVKMMVAFIILPTFYLIYWLGSKIPWRRRLADLLIASVVLAVVSLSWPLAVDLTPATQRPFVGSTQDNSMVSLSLGWNGFERLLSRHRRPVGMVPSLQTSGPQVSVSKAHLAESLNISRSAQSSSQLIQNHPRGQGFGGMNAGQPGPLRLMDKNMAGQIMWFLPLMLLGLWAALKKESLSYPLTRIHSHLFLWFGWFLMYGLVFSFMGGMMHPYYIVMLAPPISALTGIGVRSLWQSYGNHEKNRLLLPLAFLFTAIWQIYIWTGYPDWKERVIPILIWGSGLSIAGLIGIQFGVQHRRLFQRWMPFSIGLGLLIFFVSPMIWSLSAVLVPDRMVEANPNLLLSYDRQNGGGWGNNEMNISKLVSFLKNNRKGAKYLVFAQNSQSISSIIIQTGEPAVSIGGFMGRDPTLTLNQFIQLVKGGQVHYMLIGGMGGGVGRGTHMNSRSVKNSAQVGQTVAGNWLGGWTGLNGVQTGPREEIAQWVRKHGQLVKPSLWRLEPHPTRPIEANNPEWGRRRVAPMELYELKS